MLILDFKFSREETQQDKKVINIADLDSDGLKQLREASILSGIDGDTSTNREAGASISSKAMGLGVGLDDIEEA